MSLKEERLKPPSLGQYFFALTSAERATHPEVEEFLAQEFGPLGTRSQIYCFSDFSTYYEEELGGTTWKYLVAPVRPLLVDRITEIKVYTVELEDRFTQVKEGSVRRTINIDPGYLNGWQVVLSSVKNHGHRLYMKDGVYCEVTLLYQHGEFQPLPWTYRDYTSVPVLDFLRLLRNEYRKQLHKKT